MRLDGQVAVVTGGGSGIGLAIAGRFISAGATVAILDLDAKRASKAAATLGCSAWTADAADEEQLADRVEHVARTLGPIDVFCANAGIFSGGGLDAPPLTWDRMWRVNVMSHVYAARLVLPSMVDRGSGRMIHTASAAGLLTSLGNAPYAVTKHAVVAFAEWLSITYGSRGIRVSCICPQGVNTDLLRREVGTPAGDSIVGLGVVEAAEVADALLSAMDEDRFLVLPHPEIADYMARKVADQDRWLSTMRRWHDSVYT